MHFQKSTEYAVRCLVYMAGAADTQFSVKRLAEELQLPYKYLGRLMSALGTAQIVSATRGKHGGYRLGRKASEISLYDIVRVVEGEDDAHRCVLGFDSCDDKHPCALHSRWKQTRQVLLDMQRSVSLSELAGQKGIRA